MQTSDRNPPERSPALTVTAGPIVNPVDIARLTSTHQTFRSIHQKYGPPPNWSRPPGFVSLSRIILEQQVSLSAAKNHFDKLNDHIAEFSPAAILQLSDVELRNCQISRQKASYLRSLSMAIVDGALDLHNLGRTDHAEVRRRLIVVKGIGNWTVDIYLMFCLQARDIFPAGDIALLRTIRELYNATRGSDILLVSEGWKPTRSLASYFLWHYYLSKKKR